MVYRSVSGKSYHSRSGAFIIGTNVDDDDATEKLALVNNFIYNLFF